MQALGISLWEEKTTKRTPLLNEINFLDIGTSDAIKESTTMSSCDLIFILAGDGASDHPQKVMGE